MFGYHWDVSRVALNAVCRCVSLCDRAHQSAHFVWNPLPSPPVTSSVMCGHTPPRSFMAEPGLACRMLCVSTLVFRLLGIAALMSCTQQAATKLNFSLIEWPRNREPSRPSAKQSNFLSNQALPLGRAIACLQNSELPCTYQGGWDSKSSCARARARSRRRRAAPPLCTLRTSAWPRALCAARRLLRRRLCRRGLPA